MKNDNQYEVMATEDLLLDRAKGFTIVDSGWTAFDNQIFGFYDGHKVQPGLVAYLSGAELTLYGVLVRLTQGYHRTWTRISFRNIATLMGVSTSTAVSASKSLQKKSFGENDGESMPLIEIKDDGGVLLWRVVFENIPLYLSAAPRQGVPKIATGCTENRDRVYRKSRQGVPKIATPSSKEIENKIETNKKENIAPKNGAALGADIAEAEFLAELQKLQAIDGKESESNNLEIQAVVTAPPCCEAPPQADKPKRVRGKTSEAKPKKSQAKHANPEIAQDVVWSMAEGCRLIVTVFENGEPVMDKQGQPKREFTKRGQLDTVGGKLRDLGVSLDEVKRMTVWLLANEVPPYQSTNPDKYLSKLALFREYEANQGCEAIQAMKMAIKAIYGQSEAKLSAKVESALSQVAIDLIAAGRDVAWVSAFPEIWRKEYQDCGLPKSTNLINFVHLEPKSSTKNTSSSDWAEGELEEWLKGTTVGA